MGGTAVVEDLPDDDAAENDRWDLRKKQIDIPGLGAKVHGTRRTPEPTQEEKRKTDGVRLFRFVSGINLMGKP